MNKKWFFWLFSPLFALTLAGYWRLLTFTFWKDDWTLLWSSLHHFETFRDYWAHPGTPIEFMILTPFFGLHPLLWQLLGLVLHVAIALSLGLFVYTLTQSKVAARLSGILYAASFTGMDSVGWVSAHVVLWTSLFSLIGLTYFIRFCRSGNKSTFWIAILYIGIAVILDPFRMFPVFFLLPLITKFTELHKSIYTNTLIKTLLIVSLSIVIVSIFFVIYIILGQQPALYKDWYIGHYIDKFRHIYVVGNYFNSIANLLFGWVIRFPEDASTGIYSRLWSRVGFFIFCLTIGIGFEYFKKGRRKVGIIFLFLLWIFVFYIPNWLFEPMITAGATHRYMVLSNIGFVALIGYLISIIKNKVVLVTAAGLFIGANIINANYYTLSSSVYRSGPRIDSFWKRIDEDVPRPAQNLIFIYTGYDPVKTYALSLSGAYPFALRRKTFNLSDIPVVKENYADIEQLLCHDSVPLNHVFSWNLNDSGIITNESLKVRRALLVCAMDQGCVPVIDQALVENI